MSHPARQARGGGSAGPPTGRRLVLVVIDADEPAPTDGPLGSAASLLLSWLRALPDPRRTTLVILREVGDACIRYIPTGLDDPPATLLRQGIRAMTEVGGAARTEAEAWLRSGADDVWIVGLSLTMGGGTLLAGSRRYGAVGDLAEGLPELQPIPVVFELQRRWRRNLLGEGRTTGTAPAASVPGEGWPLEVELGADPGDQTGDTTGDRPGDEMDREPSDDWEAEALELSGQEASGLDLSGLDASEAAAIALPAYESMEMEPVEFALGEASAEDADLELGGLESSALEVSALEASALDSSGLDEGAPGEASAPAADFVPRPPGWETMELELDESMAVATLDEEVLGDEDEADLDGGAADAIAEDGLLAIALDESAPESFLELSLDEPVLAGESSLDEGEDPDDVLTDPGRPVPLGPPEPRSSAPHGGTPLPSPADPSATGPAPSSPDPEFPPTPPEAVRQTLAEEHAGWRALGAAVAGSRHLSDGRECDDALGTRACGDCLALAVADGAGFASRGGDGSLLAVEAALQAIAAALRGGVPPDEAGWSDLLRGVFAEALSALREAVDEDEALREVSTTLLVAVLTPQGAAVLQIGDGVIVVQGEAGSLRAVTTPLSGEYYNETTFVTSDDAEEHLQIAWIEDPEICDAALLSDGLQALAIELATNTAVPGFFEPFFRLAASDDLPQQADRVASFLQSDRVCSRTDDDKSLLVATRRTP